MLLRITVKLVVILWATNGMAQSCGTSNPGCLVPIPPQSDNSNRAAPTKWVKTFAPTIALGGDVTGTVASNTVSKIQGTTVTGTTGAGKVVFSTAPTIDSLSITTGLNVVYTTTFAPGVRGPVFLWANPSGTTSAGQNSLLQGWVGTNPTATPAANHPVAVTFAMTNGNNRFILETMNLIGQICGPAESCPSDYIDTPVNPLEIDAANSATVGWAPRNRSFNSTTGTYTKVGLTINSSPAVGRITSYMFGWANDTTGAGWAYTGVELARVLDIGFRCVVNPNGPTVDTGVAFSDSCLRDDSNSVSIIKLGNFTHAGATIDASSGATFTGGFYKGSSTAATNVLFSNGADFTNQITIDSGSSTIQQSLVNFNDQTHPKWQTGKQNDNTYVIFNNTSGNSSMVIAASDAVTFKAGVTVGSTTLLTSSVALTNNAAAATATLTNAPTSGNPTKWIPINDNGTTRNIPAW
jgi:hypothetical protein